MDGLEGGTETKQRLRAILSTISGELSVNDACRGLGIRPAYFAELRARALAGSLVALAPRAAGRPRRAAPRSLADVEELQREVDELRHEVRILRAQLDVTTVLAKTVPDARAEPARTKSEVTRRRRAPRQRA